MPLRSGAKRARLEGAEGVKGSRGTLADPLQTQESPGASNAPAGTLGTAGCPEHQAPEQGRGALGRGWECPLFEKIKGSTSEAKPRRSLCDVTRCEQPACAVRGAGHRSPRARRLLRRASKPVAVDCYPCSFVNHRSSRPSGCDTDAERSLELPRSRVYSKRAALPWQEPGGFLVRALAHRATPPVRPSRNRTCPFAGDSCGPRRRTTGPAARASA